MKLAMIIEAWHPIWGGGQAVAENLAKYLSEKQNCEVDLFVMNLSGKTDNYIEKIDNNFHIIYVGKKRNFGFLDRLLWIFELIKLIKSNHKSDKYSHIYAHANLPGIPAKILSRSLSIPIIYQVHGSGIAAMKKMYGNNIKSKILFYIEDYIQTKIKYDLQITVDKKFLERKNINKSLYIANGADIEKFDKIKNIKKENKDGLDFIFVGRLHPQKGLHYLVESVNLIKNKLDESKFIIIGEGEEKKSLKNKIKEYKIDKFFEFRGKKSGAELITEYKKADIFILPSLFEGFPLTLLEAWASKLPVLVTKVGENPNVVIDGENGFLINPGDSKELAKSIENILKTSKNDLEGSGKKGYELVKENYSLDSINLEIFNNIRKINANKN